MNRFKAVSFSIILNAGHIFATAQVIDASTCDSTTRFPVTKFAYYLQTTQEVTLDSVLKSQSNFKKSFDLPFIKNRCCM